MCVSRGRPVCWHKLVRLWRQAPALEASLPGIWHGSLSHLCLHAHTHEHMQTHAQSHAHTSLHVPLCSLSDQVACQRKSVLGRLGVLVHVEEWLLYASLVVQRFVLLTPGIPLMSLQSLFMITCACTSFWYEFSLPVSIRCTVYLLLF